jgi:hypothetical protein
VSGDAPRREDRPSEARPGEREALSEADRNALDSFLVAAHDHGYSLDDSDLARLLARDVVEPIVAEHLARATADDRARLAAEVQRLRAKAAEGEQYDWTAEDYADLVDGTVRRLAALDAAPSAPNPEEGAAALHLREHLTDGAYHPSCGYCLHRRAHGGTGLPAPSALNPDTAARAEALEQAADAWTTNGPLDPYRTPDWLRDRAAALRNGGDDQ